MVTRKTLGKRWLLWSGVIGFVALGALVAANVVVDGPTRSSDVASNITASAPVSHADSGQAIDDFVQLTPAVWSSEPASMPSPTDLAVDEKLSYMAQVERHLSVLRMLSKSHTDAHSRVELARERENEPGALAEYLAANKDLETLNHYLRPYVDAQEESETLQEEGYKLEPVGKTSDFKGTICDGGGSCADVHPLVALFFLLAGAIDAELEQEVPFGPNNEIVKFLNRPAGGPNSELVKIREALLFHDKNGEIARIVRDPIKRPLDVLQDTRDKIISPKDNGELAKIIRDPVKNDPVVRFLDSVF